MQARFEMLVSHIVPVVFAIIAVLGVVGNSLVLLVVLYGQQMRNTTNILILNLALSDLLFVTICIPPTAVDYAIGWPFGLGGCRVVQYLIHVSTYSSVYTLVLLSLDRYLAVVYPVRSIGMRTVCNATVAIVLCWIVVGAACVPIFFVFFVKEITFDHGEVRSICTFDRESYNEGVYQGIFFATSLAVPLLAILWLYMNMLLRLWRGSAATHGPGPARDKNNRSGGNSSKGQENRKRATRTVVVIIVAFAICWTPLQVVLLLRKLHLYDISSTALIVLQIVTHCFAYFNSCLNPILYAFFSPNFRAAFFSKCIFRSTTATKQQRAMAEERTTAAAGNGGSHAMSMFREQRHASFTPTPSGSGVATTALTGASPTDADEGASLAEKENADKDATLSKAQIVIENARATSPIEARHGCNGRV